MAKKRGGHGQSHSKGLSRAPMASHNAVSLRAEASGLKPTDKGGANTNPKSMLKLLHLQKLAVWAAGEGATPSLGAFFGRRFAAIGESLAVPPDPSLLSCQRCETVLQPGYNCTVRIEKNRKKSRRRGKKPSISTQNNVVYRCHFCLHKNLKRGTPKGHLKDLHPPKAKSSSKPKTAAKVPLQMPAKLGTGSGMISLATQKTEVSSPAMLGEPLPLMDSPATPLTGTTLLEMKRRKRNRSGSKKPADPGSVSTTGDSEASVGASSKRRRKSWTSLKEIAEGNEQNRNIANLKIPFFI